MYVDPERWEQEVALFRRTPLMLALGGELRGAHAFKAVTVMEVPVLLTRGSDGEVRAFVNWSPSRCTSGCRRPKAAAAGSACPYHNWTYGTTGGLVGITDREYFGEIDRSCNGLTPLPVA